MTEHERDEAAGRRLTRLLCTVTLVAATIALVVGLVTGDGEILAVSVGVVIGVALALVFTNAGAALDSSTPHREDPTP